MVRIRDVIRGFLAREEGAALVEYAILLAFIALVSIVAVVLLGTAISSRFSAMAAAFS